MSTVRKIAHNTLVQIGGKALTAVLVLFGFGVMTRYLGQEGFGFYTTVYAFLAIFGILVDLGLQMTTTQIISDPREDESRIMSNALTIRLIASLLFLGIAPLVALALPYPTPVKLGIGLAAGGFIFASLPATLTSLFQKRLVMYRVVAAEIVAKVLFVSAVLLAVRLDGGLAGIIAAGVLDSFVTFCLLAYFARRYTMLRPAFEWSVWKKILATTWPIGLTIALNLIYFKGDIVIMSLLRSQPEVGIYGAPYKFLEALINIAYLFLGLILPLLAAAVAANDQTKLKKVVQSTFEVLVAVSVPLVVGGLFVGTPLMILIAGPAFAVSGELMKILLIAAAAICCAGLFGYAVVALKAQRRMIKFYALNAAVSIVGYIYLINRYSYWGAAWMTVATELFMLGSAAWVVWRTTGFRPNLTVALKALLASAVMALGLTLMRGWPVLISVAAGALIYVAALYRLNGFDRRLLGEVLNLKQKT